MRKLRLPLQDLFDSPVRARMALLQRLGHRFTAYVFGCPNETAQAALREHRGLIEALEVIVVWGDAERTAQDLANAGRELGLRIYLSKLRRHEDAKYDGSKFNHFINHGFVLGEREQLQAFASLPVSTAVDGFIIRVARDHSAWDDILACQELEDRLGRRIALQVRLAGDNPAEPIVDDLAIANRVAETVFAGLCHPQADIFFDTFMDVDRNYFPHHGFVDRRYDPRLASYVYRNLHALLGSVIGLKPHDTGRTEGTRWWMASGGGASSMLLSVRGSQPGVSSKGPDLAVGTSVDRVDLATGASERLAWCDAGSLAIATAPCLLRFDSR